MKIRAMTAREKALATLELNGSGSTDSIWQNAVLLARAQNLDDNDKMWFELLNACEQGRLPACDNYIHKDDPKETKKIDDQYIIKFSAEELVLLHTIISANQGMHALIDAGHYEHLPAKQNMIYDMLDNIEALMKKHNIEKHVFGK